MCRGFADMVLYVEACESGSMFQGLLTDDMQIYVTTAANAYESSWGTYCPGACFALERALFSARLRHSSPCLCG